MGKRVLLIEDEPHIAEAIRYILARDGWSVASHAEGAGAMEAIRREEPDVLVLDVMLPGRSGYEILADLRTDPGLQSLPVLVLTARGHDGPDNWKAEGPCCLMAKPFVNSEIVAAVRRMAGA